MNTSDPLSISLGILALVRFLGMLVLIDLYLQKQEAKYMVLILGWLLAAVGSAWGLYTHSVLGEMDNHFTSLLTGLGTFWIGCGALLYFNVFKPRFIHAGSVLILLYGLLSFANIDLGPSPGVIIQVLIAFLITFAALFKRKLFWDFARRSYLWLVGMAILADGLTIAFSVGIIGPGNFALGFAGTSFINITAIIFFLQLEYSISSHQTRESENRYRFLFEFAPVALWEEDVSGLLEKFKELKKGGVQDIRHYISENPDSLGEFIQHLRVLDVNQEAQTLYNAASKQQLIDSLEKPFLPESFQINLEVVTALFEEQTRFENASSIQTLQGDPRDIIMRRRLGLADTEFPRSLVSLTDITQQKYLESQLRLSEKRFRGMVNSQPDLIFRELPDGTITFVNDAVCQFLNLPREELIGKIPEQRAFIPVEDQEGVAKIRDSLGPENPLLIHENRNIDNDGKQHWFQWVNQVIFDDDGNVIEHQFVGRDITKGKLAEEGLKKRTDILEILHDVTLDIGDELDLSVLLRRVIELGANTLNTNMGGSVYLYQSEDDILVLAENVGADEEYVDDVIRPGEGLAGQVYQTKQTLYVKDYKNWEGRPNIDDDFQFSSMIGIPLLNHGEAIGVLILNADQGKHNLISDDIWSTELFASLTAVLIQNSQLFSELQNSSDDLAQLVEDRTFELRKRIHEYEELNNAMINLMEDQQITNQVLEKTSQQLEEANKELESFSYSVSHDLRAPLRHIKSFVQLLLEGETDRLDPTSHHYLQNIFKSSNRMGHLIDDLLKFSRTSQSEMELQPVNMQKIINSIKKELSLEMVDRKIKWHIHDLPVVQTDYALSRILWMNLISNAIKFTALRGETHIEIGCKTSDDSNEVIFFIRDNGIGFNPEYAHKLFGVFQRLHRQKDFEGTGIGLATVKRIIHRHGGKVWAESKEGEGATFYFTL
ncbi:MAG: PAS domain S-box protein [Anaerolineaceae bacterium]|nr:PAS domain S-box protein [Anaerolineaceae bacterium]